MRIKHLSGIFLLLLILSAVRADGQTIWEDPQASVNRFLARQAQKGNIELQDFVMPLSRQEISDHLKFLSDSVTELSATERSELAFFKREYTEFDQRVADSTTFFGKDRHGRWRALGVETPDFLLRAEPLLGLELVQGGQKSIFKRHGGLQFWGHAGKRVGFQFEYRDNHESGDLIDTIRQFSNETGFVRTANIDPDAKSINYSSFRGNISYSWNNGSVTAGYDHLLWGYGENGRLVMSQKAPAYPLIRLDYQPLKWLKFNYAHAWLHSGMIDSARTYGKGNDIYGTDREIYVSKFLATHSLNFLPLKGLSISVGESMVYSDKLQVGYLIPVMFFKAYDQISSRYKISTGSNSQFFLQASSRNHIPKTHIYGTLFIDEIRMSEAFNPEKSRNQLGFNIGASVTDPFINYLTVGLEYTRINPFVYQNLIESQQYTNHNYLLGDWIGQNSDRLTAWLRFNPYPRLSTNLQLNYIRKGNDGTLEDQYYAEPQPGFLESGKTEQKQLLFEVRYDLLNQLQIRAAYYKQAGIIRPDIQKVAVPNEFRFGLSYGL